MQNLQRHQDNLYALTTRSITISVEPEYLEDHSEPEKHCFVWAYHVIIENQGFETVQLQSRYWNIMDENGHIEEVRGDGVIGEQPILAPGDIFEYSSGAPLPTPSGIMRGHYVMKTHAGKTFRVEIPTFSLDSPHVTRRFH